ncbi:MAG: DUF349 domain-containing protein, partial [Flavobacterium sp.]|nr:DUF349 domain-containing protein [Flavobacterium sp.]
MLEEKNDNLLEADGNLENNSPETIQTETAVLEDLAIVETSNEETAEQVEEIAATIVDGELPVADALIEEEVVVDSETPIEPVEAVAEVASSETTSENTTIIDAIADTNAEESEDETLKERHDIPMLDYDTLSLESLVEELKNLVTNEKVMSVKDHVEEIKKSFLAKYYHLLEEKKEEFLAENPDTNEEFQYYSPLKTQFDQYYSLFRDNKNTHFKSLQTNLKTNLENRLAIVEELKELINPQENIKDTLKHFNDLRERWKNAGPIPKDKYNHVWNNYHFHVENFYDYLHLDREARDLDFKHNLEQKQKIVARVEELVNEADVNKAFRELQDLHKIWKEDIGPVSREHRDEIWNKFSDLTKQMHDKREVLFENMRGTELENLEKKKEIIAKIEVLATEKVNAHSQWLAQI